MIIKEFEEFLQKTSLSENSKYAYIFALKQFTEKYSEVNQDTLRAYKLWLIENYKPQTVNLRIRGMNCYLESIEQPDLKLPFVKVQQRYFLESVISQSKYGNGFFSTA